VPTVDRAYAVHVKELDFRAEAAALDLAAALVARLGLAVVVPRPIFASPAVLGMTWCRGSKIAKVREDGVFLADGTRLDDVQAFGDALLDAYAALFLLAGLLQLDPHAGNVLVAGRAPVLLDFGMHDRLDDATRLAFAGLIVAVAADDLVALADALARLGVVSHFAAADSLAHLKFLFRASHPDLDANRHQVQAFLDDLKRHEQRALAKARAANDRLVSAGADTFSSLVRQLDLLHGYLATLPCHVDFLKPYAKWAARALKERPASRDRRAGGASPQGRGAPAQGRGAITTTR